MYDPLDSLCSPQLSEPSPSLEEKLSCKISNFILFPDSGSYSPTLMFFLAIKGSSLIVFLGDCRSSDFLAQALEGGSCKSANDEGLKACLGFWADWVANILVEVVLLY